MDIVVLCIMISIMLILIGLIAMVIDMTCEEYFNWRVPFMYNIAQLSIVGALGVCLSLIVMIVLIILEAI